ncbi:hypothetical protein LOD99_10206 [Oopsacas minuta]|uniref:HECT domain-containing protein n=1 Tax=Oopsacas minuta TaxID=111878 RepID=A0AAV7KI44_9METZ|nr:hypothetical protein LOD99_10206 [Oopsacas minuta]
MSNVYNSTSPFLHLLPVQSGESLVAFQNRLVLSLTENNPSQLSIPISSPSPPAISISEDNSDNNTVSASELQQCMISSNCIALLTKQGRAGRIKLEVTNEFPSSSSLHPQTDVTSQQVETTAIQFPPPIQTSVFHPHLLPTINPQNISNQLAPPILTTESINPVMPVETSDSNLRDINGLRLNDMLLFSEVEWTPIDQVFTCMAIVTSEIILVSKGQLYSWSLEETEVSLHPKSADLQLTGEEIICLSAARLRVSIATLSGKVATFYDTSITRYTDNTSGSNLITTLSHPLLSVRLPSGDTIISLSVSETASYLLSKSGRVFWWGLLPTDKKQKSSSRSQSSEPISVNSFVSLNSSSPCTPGCLLLNLTTPYHPILATMVTLDTNSDYIQVKLLSGEGKEVRWELSKTVSLEDHVVLGRVIAVDNGLAVINTAQNTESSEFASGCIKVFPLDKLQVVNRSKDRVDISLEDKESVNTPQGLVQILPTCLLDPEERLVGSGVITGFRCISLTSHIDGPFLLLERLCDNKIFLLDSALSNNKQSTPRVFSGSVKNKLNWNNATCDEESIPAAISGLLATKLPSAKFVASSCSNTQILLDSHGYIRPIQSFYRLVPPFCHVPTAFESISMSRLLIKSDEYIVLLCVGKDKTMIRAIEDDNLELVKELTEKYIHKSITPPSGEYEQVKRPKISPELSETQSERNYLTLEESTFFLGKSCGNKNILHTCIHSNFYRNTSQKVSGKLKDTPDCIKFDKSYFTNSFEEIRWKRYSENTESFLQPSLTNILNYFLSLPALTDVIHHLLCQRDVSGYTPFMLALKNQDLASATMLLDYIDNMPSNPASLRQQSHLYEDAIAQSGDDELLPIQVLLFNSALPYCEFGLKTLLIQLPNSGFQTTEISPRSLLSYIQNRYPSAYRCEANIREENPITKETVLSQPSLRNSISQFKYLCEVDNKYPSFASVSNSIEFLVAFSDVREMRDAICDLQSNQISGLRLSQYNFVINVQQYYGQELFHASWNVDMVQSYTTRPDDKIQTELSRVSLVKRLIEVLSPQQQAGQEDILSSILCDRLLVAYLEDMHHISDTTYKFTFGKTALAEPKIQQSIVQQQFQGFGMQPMGMQPIGMQPVGMQPIGMLRSLQQPQNLFNLTTQVTTDNDASEVATEHVDMISVEIESILYILANSWTILSTAILNSRPPEDSSFSQRDSFTLSLILNSTSSVLKTILQVIMSKIEQIQPDLLLQMFTNSKVGLTLEEEDKYVITVVKKFVQSLVRLYTKAIVSDKLLDNVQGSSTSNTQINMSTIRDRVFSVLRAFNSLSVQELFIAAQGLCWPIITGNLKHYQTINFTEQQQKAFQINNQPQSSTIRQIFHHQHVQVIATTSLELPSLPQTGLKLPFSELAVKKLEVRTKEKRERSDHWGPDDFIDIASSGSDSADEDEDITYQPAVTTDVAERDEYEESNDEEEYNQTVGVMQQTTNRPYNSGGSRISWLVDGLENTLTGYQPQNIPGLFQQPQIQSPLNTLNGGIILARTFSRIMKAALKLLLPLPDDSDSNDLYTDLPNVSLPATTQSRMLSNLPELVEPAFQWAARLLDLAENQLEQGKRFKLDSRYTHTLPPGDLNNLSTRDANNYTPLTKFGDYTNYLLCLHTGESSNLLPVIDIQSYEHVAFILDAHIYFASNWEKCTHITLHTPTATPVSNTPKTDSNFFLRQPSLIVSKHKQQQIAEPNFKIPLKIDIPLAEKPHLLKPEASNTILFSVPTTPTHVISSPNKPTNNLNVLSYTQLQANPSLSICQLNTQELINRWKNVIKAFVDVFVGTGPSNEPDNFLIARAGFVGKKARFYNLIERMNITQSMSGYSSMQLTVNRSELLKDSLSKIYSLAFTPSGFFNVTFEGEQGGGAGVIAGFYTALANALKSDEKLPLDTESLFHEPGKIPEQATFYAPTPTLLASDNALQIERLTYYRAIGKFFGMCLYSKQAIPLVLSRHVLKYLLDRQISWHDVGFYNADLYEGLRRMIVHCQEEEMTHEVFQSIYMLNFDATVNGTICEIKPGGKSIPVTPDNIREYVRLYSMYLMIGSVKQELEEMKTGFRMIIPPDLTQGLTAEDLQLLLSGGNTTVSYTRLKQQTNISFNPSSSEAEKASFVKNFFKLIRKMTNSQRQQFLYFGTGSALLSGDSMVLNIHATQVGGMEAPLPTAATCSRSIQMPCYRDYDTMKCKIIAAIACDSYEFA